MKILIYTNILDNGGISKFVCSLNNGFNKRDIESSIVTFEKNTIYNNDAALLNCKNHFDRISKLRNYIKDNNVDFIITNTWFETLIVKFSLIFLKKEIKVISVVHIRPNLWGIDKNDYIKLNIAKIALESTSNVIAVSDELKNALINNKLIKSEKATTIYNPVVTYNIEKYKNINIENKEVINVVIIGWIQVRKAQDIIINAFNNVKAKNYILNFIGGIEDKEYKNKIDELIVKYNMQDKVKFWGPQKDVFKILKKMDVLVSASRGEALPTVVIEAMSTNTVVISSDCDYGPKEILKDGEYGLLFKVDDYDELARCFDRLVSNNNLYNGFLRKANKRSELFTEDKCIDGYLRLLQ